jgi:hypothetical protein
LILNCPANGLQIMLWDCNRISDLNWAFPAGAADRTFALESRIAGSTGFCLDVPGGSSTPGVALQLFRCNQSATQLWRQPNPIIE